MALTPNENAALYYKRHPERVALRAKKWRANNPEAYQVLVDKEAARATTLYHSDPEYRLAKNKENRDRYHKTRLTRQANTMWSSAKKRAKKAGLPFDIEATDILIPEYCPVFGTKLVLANGKLADNSASLDRIVPELGYIRGNIMVISHLANMMKSKASQEQLKQFAEWILREPGVTYDGSAI